MNLIVKHTQDLLQITLNRPTQMNSITRYMLAELMGCLKLTAKIVLLRGNGKAFSAGGNLKDVNEAINKDPIDCSLYLEGKQTLLEYSKLPLVTVMDGYVMGGGAGFAMISPIRIATENSKFSMPEVRLGLPPNMGGARFLSDMPHNMGIKVGLTGEQVIGSDLCHLGLADYLILSKDVAHICEEIEKSYLLRDLDSVREFISKYCQKHHTHYIADEHLTKYLNEYDLPTILKVLRQHNYDGLVEEILKHSPMAQSVFLEMIRMNRPLLSLRENLALEWHIEQQMLMQNDVREGLHKFIVDKQHTPQWSPAHNDKAYKFHSYFDDYSDRL